MQRLWRGRVILERTRCADDKDVTVVAGCREIHFVTKRESFRKQKRLLGGGHPPSLEVFPRH